MRRCLHRLTMFPVFLCILLTFFAGTGALIIPRQDNGTNDGIQLAVKPKCGPLWGNMSDVNAGLDLERYKTIVSFGVSLHRQYDLNLLTNF